MQKAVQDGSKEAIFAHEFLTMTWNLICSSKNTVHIHVNHITWGTDSISIRFAHTKTNVVNSDQACIWHVYANPYNLEICAVTALTKYLATFSPKQDGKLFDEKSYNSFRNILKRLFGRTKRTLREWEYPQMILGHNLSDRVLLPTAVVGQLLLPLLL